MLQSIIQFSVKNKLLVGLALLGMVIAGIYNLTRLPIDAVPDITNNQVIVITTSPSLGAADIERLITFPVEQTTRNIPGMIEQRSFSRFGLSLVTLVFDDHTDVYWARQQVAERLQLVQQVIPAELGIPYMGPVTTGLGEIYQYVLRPLPGYEQQYDAQELRTLQDWVVRKQLLGTEGVADVSSFGGFLKQLEVAVEPAKLDAAGITIKDLMDALEANNQNTGGSYIEKGPTVLFIRSEGLTTSLDDIRRIPVKWLPDGSPVKVSDVAEVRYGNATRFGAMTYNDQGEVAGGIVMMLKGENSAHVIEHVKERIVDIQKSLPKGVIIEPFLDRTKMVDNAIGTVERNLMEGALIVVLVLVIFLGNIRAGLLVATVIPLSMLFAVSMMVIFGVSGNLMSLGALDFGLIVDGAVIIVEAVMHRLHGNPEWAGMKRIDRGQLEAEVKSASGKMMSAAVFGQAIILIVYLPILSLQGIEGKMFRPMAMTVAFALLGAFLLSLTYVPMMSSLVMSLKIRHKPNLIDRVMKAIERLYENTLRVALRLPVILVVSCLIVFGTSVYVLNTLGGEFIPQLEEGDFAVESRVLTGSSLNTTIQSTTQAAGILKRKFPEVEKVVTKIGSGEIPTDPMPIEASDMMIILKPQQEWTSAKTFPELAEKMQEELQVVPGLTVGFQYPVQMRFNELMTGAKQDVVCKIYGENLDSLARHADELGRIISTVEGAQDLYVEAVTGLPEIVVNFNRPALASYGLSVEDVNHTLQASFSGANAGILFVEGRRMDVVLRLKEESRSNIEDVRNLLVRTPLGSQIPLRNVADVDLRVGPNQIQHENAQRRITVGFNVRGKDVQSVVEELKKKADKRLVLPDGYYITYGGQFENLNAAKMRLAIAVPAAMALIFLLLYFAFSSIKHSLLVFSAIPLSAIGGVYGLLLRDMPFSISAGVGFIALFGVAVLNGIVLLSEFREQRLSGETDILQLILRGAKKRIRPVLMTAAVASLGFLPMALSHSPGSEVQRPLATVVIGGLITSTLLTLIVLPVVYYYVEGGKRGPIRRKKLAAPLAGALLLLIGLLSSENAFSQTITLQAALDSAKSKNIQLAMASKESAVARMQEKSAWSLPSTELYGEYGQINTINLDNKFSLSQGMQFPTVYTAQRRLQEAYTQQAEQRQYLTEAEVWREVTQTYYELLWLQEKERLLLRADSLYAQFVRRQEERLNAGDANLLEKLAAEARKAEIHHQLISLQSDLDATQDYLGMLLQSKTRWLPAPQELRRRPPSLALEAALSSAPPVRVAQAGIEIAQRQWKTLRQQRLPSLSVGFTTQTFIGWQTVGTTDTYFGADRRFSVVSFGLSAPLLLNHSQARSEAAKLQITLAEMQATQAMEAVRRDYNSLQHKLASQDSILQWYQVKGLEQARKISELAELQLSSGEISYLEWMMLVHQVIQLESDHLDAIRSWNQALISLESLSTSN